MTGIKLFRIILDVAKGNGFVCIKGQDNTAALKEIRRLRDELYNSGVYDSILTPVVSSQLSDHISDHLMEYSFPVLESVTN